MFIAPAGDFSCVPLERNRETFHSYGAENIRDKSGYKHFASPRRGKHRVDASISSHALRMNFAASQPTGTSTTR